MKIPDSVKEIGTDVFGGCKNLKEITFSDSDKVFMYMDSFYGLDNIEKVYVKNYRQLEERGMGEFFRKFKCYSVDDETGIITLSLKGEGNINYEEIMYSLGCGRVEAIIIALMFNREEIEKLGNLKYILNDIANKFVNRFNYKNLKGELPRNKEFNSQG